MRLALVFSCVLLAQPPGFDKPVFKSDTRDPKSGGAAELLDAVCPGRVENGEQLTCRGGCEQFPGDVVKEWAAGWSITGILRGHFLRPRSEDAILSESGCLPHSANFGGSFLLSRESGRWRMIWFKAALITERCRIVTRSDRRDLLVCQQSWGGQGTFASWINLFDLTSPPANSWAARLFSAVDDRAVCGGNDDGMRPTRPITTAYLEAIEFRERGMSIRARYGRLVPSKAQLPDCIDGRIIPAVPMKTYRIDYVFDGQTYRVAPNSRAAAALFKELP